MAFRSLLSFLTRFPLGTGSLSEVAESTWALPLAGVLVATLLGGIGLVSFTFLPEWAAILVLLLALFGLEGNLHLDGLSDLADAMASQGTIEHRQRVLKDPHSGVAGILAVALFLIVVVVSLAEFPSTGHSLGGNLPVAWMGHTLAWPIFFALIVAELNAAVAMVFVMGVGRTSPISVLARPLMERVRFPTMLFGLILAWGISVLLGGLLVVCVAVSGVTAIYLARMSNKSLGGVNGDVLGATHEIVFAASLFLAALLPFTPLL
ncbi:MAG: adenosylcobinamide-GDP ribazoletransferase [Nitrososphaerota archaeon]|nr:adenosylcobinamide-GDP ribazoletransferase [Nitrososphaerota archaeon]